MVTPFGTSLGYPFFTFNQDTMWGLKLHYMMLSAIDAIKKKIVRREATQILTLSSLAERSSHRHDGQR